MINREDYQVVSGKLLEDVRLMAGEPRVRYLYIEPENIDRVKEKWQSELGEKVIIKGRDEAISEGLFGANTTEVARERIGELRVS